MKICSLNNGTAIVLWASGIALVTTFVLSMGVCSLVVTSGATCGVAASALTFGTAITIGACKLGADICSSYSTEDDQSNMMDTSLLGQETDDGSP